MNRIHIWNRINIWVSCTVSGATATPTFSFSPPTSRSDPPILPDLMGFWLLKEYFSPQARKAIGFEDFLVHKLFFLTFAATAISRQSFLPTNFFSEISTHAPEGIYMYEQPSCLTAMRYLKFYQYVGTNAKIQKLMTLDAIYRLFSDSSQT